MRSTRLRSTRSSLPESPSSSTTTEILLKSNRSSSTVPTPSVEVDSRSPATSNKVRNFGCISRSTFNRSLPHAGTTTTPFSMLRVNGCGRFDLAASALRKVVVNFTQMDNISREDATRVGSVVAEAHSFIAGYLHQNQQARKYAEATQLGSLFCPFSPFIRFCRRTLIRGLSSDHPSLTEIPSFD